jgi:hypothetical protein
LPEYGQLFLCLATLRITNDFIADCLIDCWHEVPSSFSATVNKLFNWLTYPSCHCKYTPNGRVWGGLEQHWNGSLPDFVDTVL